MPRPIGAKDGPLNLSDIVGTVTNLTVSNHGELSTVTLTYREWARDGRTKLIQDVLKASPRRPPQTPRETIQLMRWALDQAEGRLPSEEPPCPAG